MIPVAKEYSRMVIHRVRQTDIMDTLRRPSALELIGIALKEVSSEWRVVSIAGNSDEALAVLECEKDIDYLSKIAPPNGYPRESGDSPTLVS